MILLFMIITNISKDKGLVGHIILLKKTGKIKYSDGGWGAWSRQIKIIILT